MSLLNQNLKRLILFLLFVLSYWRVTPWVLKRPGPIGADG